MSFEQIQPSKPETEKTDIQNSMLDQAMELLNSKSADAEFTSQTKVGSELSKDATGILASFSIIPDGKSDSGKNGAVADGISKCAAWVPSDKGTGEKGIPDDSITKCSAIIPSDKGNGEKNSPDDRFKMCSVKIPSEHILPRDKIFLCASRIPDLGATELDAEQKEEASDQSMKGDKSGDKTEESQTYEALNKALESGSESDLKKLLYGVETKEDMQELEDAVDKFNKEHKGSELSLSVGGRPGNAQLHIGVLDENNGMGCGGTTSRWNIDISYDSSSATYWTNSGIMQNPEREIDVKSALEAVQERVSK